MISPSLQNLLEPKAGVGSVMMVSVGAKVEQSDKPSYKMVNYKNIYVTMSEKSDYYLRQGSYVFTPSVCLFVCLSAGLHKKCWTHSNQKSWIL